MASAIYNLYLYSLLYFEGMVPVTSAYASEATVTLDLTV